MLKRFFYFVAGIVVLLAGALLFMVVHGDSRSNNVLTLYDTPVRTRSSVR